MKYKIGDIVLGQRFVSKKSDGYFCDKTTILGKIVFIPKSRRYAVIDTGLYREGFCFSDLKLVKKKSGAV